MQNYTIGRNPYCFLTVEKPVLGLINIKYKGERYQ
jgi:hypothetical protein